MASTSERIGYIYLMGSLRDREIYVRCTPKVLEAVTDKMFDLGFKVGQCAGWNFWQHVHRGSECFEFDDDDTSINF